MNIYNEEKKDMFLNQFPNEDTRMVYKRIFKKSKEMEENVDVDLFNFDDDMYGEFILNGLQPDTKDSVRNYCNVLSSYVQWAIENSYSKHEINPIRRRPEYFYQFVSDKKLYMSFDEKETVLFSLMNDQDKFLVQALFEGIQGKKLCELSNLKISNVVKNEVEKPVDYVDYSVILERKGKIINLPISEQTYDLAYGANAEKEYFEKNGTSDSNNNIKGTSAMDSSEYVIKKINTNTNRENKISHYSLYNRLDMLRELEEFEDFKECLATKNLVRSGMIYWAKKLYERDGKLGRTQMNEVCERYNVTYKWSHKDFLNLETIKELYGEK